MKTLKQKRFRLKKLTKAMITGLMVSCTVGVGTPALAQISGGATLAYQVKQPNTEYTESMVDLDVKVLGGEIKLERTWVNGRWYINPAWANLRLIADPLDNSIKAIDRVGAIYKRSGDSSLYESGTVYIKHIEEKDKESWRWYDANGNWITYDALGRMTGYGDSNNITVTFIRDDEGRLIEIRDHHGKMVYTFSYDNQERLIAVKDREDRKVSYTWEEERLTKVTDVLGYEWLYGYNPDGQITSRTEPDGGVVKVDYAQSMPTPATAMRSGKEVTKPKTNAVAASGGNSRDAKIARVGKVTEKTGAVTLYQLEYNKGNQQYTITVEDPFGKKAIGIYDKDGRLLSRSINGELQTTIVRDGKYHTKTINERGLTTITDRDTNYRPVKIIRPDGSVVSYKYDNTLNKPLEYVNALGITSNWSYDAKGNMLQYTEARGKPEARTSQYSYDAYGQQTQIIIKGGGSPDDKAITWQFTFDDNGNISQITDARGNITKTIFNTQGQLLSTTNALGNTWRIDYDAAGQISSSTDPLGNTTQYTSDALGRITKTINALGQEFQYSYEYQQGQDAGWKVSQTDALGYITTYQYDAVGNLIQLVLPSGETENRTYDAQGRLLNTRDAAGNVITRQYGTPDSGIAGLIAATLYPSYQEHYRYNALGLPTQITQMLSDREKLTTQITYDAIGQRVSMTDAANRTSQFSYDALGRQVKQLDAMGNAIQQAYDVLDNITRVTDAKGNSHQFEYDGNGNLIKETTPSGKITNYTYDVTNQLILTVDAQGNATTYQYDPAGRVTQISYTQAQQTQPEQIVEYTYDQAGDIQQIVQKGDIYTRFVYERDGMGRIQKETITYNDSQVNAFTKILQYTYDANGRTRTITYPDGSEQSYIYKNGQLNAVNLPNAKTVEWNNYAWSRPQQVKWSNVTESLKYDTLQRTQQQEIKANGTNTQLIQRGYAYDTAGNIIERTTEDGNYHYAYDKLDRLAQAQPPLNLQQSGKLPLESFAYDMVGNRVGSSQQPGNWQYNQDNQLLQYGIGTNQTTYTYTANGHVATETQADVTKAYAYDATDRLIRITSTANGTETEIAHYGYDPMGRRITKTVKGNTTYYLYAAEGLVAELNEQGEMIKAYGWLTDTTYGTSPLWQAEPKEGENTITDLKQAQFHTLITDYLGTPQIAVNAQGAISWKAQAEVFGKTMLDAQNKITMNLRFPGQYFDEETGTHYNYFRDYNPSTGRYVQRDPIGLLGGINAYQYANANSLKHIDPDGLWSVGEQIKRFGESLEWAYDEASEKINYQFNRFKDSLDWAYREFKIFDFMEASGIDDFLLNDCAMDCIRNGRVPAGFVAAPVALLPFPKKVLPPYRVVLQSQRKTTLLSVLAHFLKNGPIKRFIREAGRVASEKVVPPVLVGEGAWDLGTIVRCYIICTKGDEGC